MSVGLLNETVGKLKALGPMYMTVDTFMYLVLDRQLIRNEDVAGVFPWAANKTAIYPPTMTVEADIICRRVAWYYWHMHYHKVTDWTGEQRDFDHKAANTVSFRAYAPYQTVKKETRALIKPQFPDMGEVLQFDWSGAEWLLILQNVGYLPPDGDPYHQDLFGTDRETAKKIILPRIYGAEIPGIVANSHGAVTEDQVRIVLAHLERQYPKAVEWASRLSTDPNCRYSDFNGFHLDLGDETRKRANRWAQTSLQLCKWDLVRRLTEVPGMCRTQNIKQGRVTVERPWSCATGDIHDQLLWDIYRGEEGIAHQIIDEIRKPAFGSVQLTPRISIAQTWGL